MKSKQAPTMPQDSGLNLQRITKRFIVAPLAMGWLILAVGCASDPSRSTGQAIDDQSISRRVEYALTSDPAFKYPDVRVTTFQRTVQLSGFVDRSEQKERAEEIAKKTEGVKNVKNRIELK
jgi:hyperosmotically inducible protein